MVVIRLSRGGSKGRPFFNIVVTDKRERRDGRFIERIGFYNPIAKGGEEGLRIAQDRLTYWRGVGAQASPTVERLINQAAAKAATKGIMRSSVLLTPVSSGSEYSSTSTVCGPAESNSLTSPRETPSRLTTGSPIKSTQ